MKEINIRPYHKGQILIVDDEDYEWLSKFSIKEKKGYPTYTKKTKKNGKTTEKQYAIHRLIMGQLDGLIPEGMQVDHIDGNPLNCQRGNLRICTPQQNYRNKHNNPKIGTEFKGVQKRDNKKFSSFIMAEGKNVRIGTFTSIIAAANSYNHYAKIYYGEFASLNEVEFMPKEEWLNYITTRGLKLRKDTDDLFCA